MTIEVVFFDAGETLVRPHPSFPELFAQVCASRGLPVSADDVAAVREELAPYLVDLAHETGVDAPSLSPEGSRTFWTHLYRRFLGALGIENEAMAQELYRVFSSTSSYKLFDDVLPVLDRLQADYRLGLISNFEEWLEEMLVELEVGHFFEIQVISGIAGVEKPDRRIYEIALEKAGVEPARAVHVGDSPRLDIEPATAVGMSAVLLDRLGRIPEYSPSIASLEELPDLLANFTGWTKQPGSAGAR